MEKRCIKFRAWDKDGKGMFENVQAREGWLFRDFLDNPRFILMQFTGLKDKNNKEIYEKDEIRGNSPMMIENVSCGIVVWDDKCLCWVVIHDITGLLLRLYDIEDLEVIGNIHENPELLEEKQCSVDER